MKCKKVNIATPPITIPSNDSIIIFLFITALF
jgi:hypothetical protein